MPSTTIDEHPYDAQPSVLARPLHRRAFITRGLAIVGGGAVMPAAFVRAVFAEGTPDGVSSARRTLVVLQLGGGNDGLNTVVPYTDRAYYDARPRLAIAPETALPLDGNFALHPSMSALKTLYDRGRVAVVQGVGYPQPNRSHFRSMEIWQTASLEDGVHSGWLGRLLDATRHEQRSQWRAANVGSSLSPTLMSQQSFVPALDSVPAYVLQSDPRLPKQAERRVTDWARIYSRQAAFGGALSFVSKTGIDAYESTVSLARETKAYTPSATYPGSTLGTALQTAARLVTSNLGTGIVYVTTGGFDTHAGQATTQANLLKGVSDALGAFYADLEARELHDDVATLVWTEFGRRVRENGSGGTDHGTAGPVFLVGGGVRGGLHGEPSSAARPDGNGDLQFTTDFRSVYASLLAQWFRADPAYVLDGRFPELPLF